MNDRKTASDIAIIKNLLICLLIISFVFLGLVVYSVVDSYSHEPSTPRYSNNTFNQSLAKEYSDDRDWARLLEYSTKWVESEPDHEDANWYRAKALFKLKKYNEALTAFENIKSIAPMWTEHADNYIAACREQIK